MVRLVRSRSRSLCAVQPAKRRNPFYIDLALGGLTAGIRTLVLPLVGHGMHGTPERNDTRDTVPESHSW